MKSCYYISLTCVESFPRPDRRFFPAALQFVFSIQEPLYFYRGQLIHVFQLLKFSETLRSSASCKTGRSFGFLVHVRFHTFSPFYVYEYNKSHIYIYTLYRFKIFGRYTYIKLNHMLVDSNYYHNIMYVLL